MDCPVCQTGTLRVYTSRVNELTQTRVRYYRCCECGHRPLQNKRIVSLERAPVRKAMKRIWASRNRK